MVGKTTDKHFAAGIQDYTSRIGHYLPFELVVIPELKATKNLSEEQQKQQEGVNILASLDAGDYVVLLDEHGREYTSMEFSRYIEKKMASVPRR